MTKSKGFSKGIAIFLLILIYGFSGAIFKPQKRWKVNQIFKL